MTDFNCTIQELKPKIFEQFKELTQNFNCTIQELKREDAAAQGIEFGIFQLHHTGIKTQKGITKGKNLLNFNCTIQELKLENSREQLKAIEDFNCTIQELKHKKVKKNYIGVLYFNCTIQELKHGRVHVLHHTQQISIAPYRN